MIDTFSRHLVLLGYFTESCRTENSAFFHFCIDQLAFSVKSFPPLIREAETLRRAGFLERRRERNCF